ncbi:hypothetical protein [Pseudomonas sp. KU43P]|uniref:hypothetical protein n=1 Tax=Pseudomonas sp. KU43P TaxID=2487887 RepID=UPI0012A896C5|nr:hypothetical protein [Pseudomonas sp. KU43P]BBH47736.1 hypothetical protein KU43P_42130 [Pseudomonas sp. KU43P]
MTSQPAAPLTIIAVFAGIIESSALATLPFLSEESQNLYTWFLVGFPFFLTALFFLTLNFNYKSLYKPEETGNVYAQAASAPEHKEKQSTLAETEPITVMLSGPNAQQMITQQVLKTLAQPHESGRTWVFCNLDKQQCFRLSVDDLPENTAQFIN